MDRIIETPEQVIAELRAMSSQFVCPKDTYFSSMADVVEELLAVSMKLPELTTEERAAMDAMDILGTYEKRFAVAMNAALRWFRERNELRKVLKSLDIHQRKCWDCGNIAWHKGRISPCVNCIKCLSRDTRAVER